MIRTLLLLAVLVCSALVPASAATNSSGARLHSISTSRAAVASSQSSETGVSITLAIGDTFHGVSSNASGATLQSDLAPRAAREVESTPQTTWFFY